MIKSLFECVIFLGKQGLSYRGHRDDSTYEGVINAGNFTECVYFRAQTDGILANHLKAANFFSILADEVTDCSNQEQLSLAIRFVDSEGSTREEFMDFISETELLVRFCLLLFWLAFSHGIFRSPTVGDRGMMGHPICLPVIVEFKVAFSNMPL